jgi:hypothetical protein
MMKTAIASMMLLGSLATPIISRGLAADALPPGLSAEAIANAKTPADHQAIADAYAKEAEQLRAQAMAHRHMDSHYNEPGYLSSKLGFPRHCRALVQSYESAAKDADALAKAHHQMAEAAARKTK